MENKRLSDTEAGLQVELKVMRFLDYITSCRRYFPRTHLHELSEKELAIARNMKPGEKVSVFLSDNEDSASFISLDKKHMKQLAEMRKKYGGMDICALSTDKNGITRRDYIEVKTDRNCKFLFRNIPRGVTEACLGFELWDHVYYCENNRRKQRPPSEWKTGWLHGYMHPQEHNETIIEDFRQTLANGKHQQNSPPLYTTPSVLIYGLENEVELPEPNIFGDMWEAWPYAYVWFENMEALFDLLNSKLEGRLNPWTIEPTDTETLNKFKNLIFKNMLYIPLAELVQLPRVTVTLRPKHFPDTTIVKERSSQESVPFDKQVFQQRKLCLEEAATSDEERKQRLDALEIKVIDGNFEDLYFFSEDFDEQYADRSKPFNIFYVPRK